MTDTHTTLPETTPGIAHRTTIGLDGGYEGIINGVSYLGAPIDGIYWLMQKGGLAPEDSAPFMGSAQIHNGLTTLYEGYWQLWGYDGSPVPLDETDQLIHNIGNVAGQVAAGVAMAGIGSTALGTTTRGAATLSGGNAALATSFNHQGSTLLSTATRMAGQASWQTLKLGGRGLLTMAMHPFKTAKVLTTSVVGGSAVDGWFTGGAYSERIANIPLAGPLANGVAAAANGARSLTDGFGAVAANLIPDDVKQTLEDGLEWFTETEAGQFLIGSGLIGPLIGLAAYLISNTAISQLPFIGNFATPIALGLAAYAGYKAHGLFSDVSDEQQLRPVSATAPAPALR